MTQITLFDFNPKIKSETPGNAFHMSLITADKTELSIFCNTIDLWWQLRHLFAKHPAYVFHSGETYTNDRTLANQWARKFMRAHSTNPYYDPYKDEETDA